MNKNKYNLKNQALRVSRNMVGLWVTAACIPPAFIASEVPGSRNNLPEPFDFMDHASNFGVSASCAGLVALELGNIYANHANKSDTPPSALRSKTIIAAATICLGAAANALFETHTGLSLINSQRTPNTVDLYYGIAGATVGAFIVPKYTVTNSSGSTPR